MKPRPSKPGIASKRRFIVFSRKRFFLFPWSSLVKDKNLSTQVNCVNHVCLFSIFKVFVTFVYAGSGLIVLYCDDKVLTSYILSFLVWCTFKWFDFESCWMSLVNLGGVSIAHSKWRERLRPFSHAPHLSGSGMKSNFFRSFGEFGGVAIKWNWKYTLDNLFLHQSCPPWSVWVLVVHNLSACNWGGRLCYVLDWLPVFL